MKLPVGNPDSSLTEPECVRVERWWWARVRWWDGGV